MTGGTEADRSIGSIGVDATTGVNDDPRASQRPLVIEAEPAFRTAHANPYNARLATTIAAEGHTVRDLSYVRLFTQPIDIVHLHWPELTFLTGRRWRVFARMTLFRAGLRVARLRNGTKVVWTVHNVASHEQRSTPGLRAMHRRLLAREVDGLLSLSAGGLDAARDAYPELADRPGAVTPHGHYRLDYDVTLPRDEARAECGIRSHAPVVASVGMIRSYKNIPELVRTVVESDADLRLVIAGKPAGGQLAAEIRTAAADDPRVVLDLAFQSDAAIMAWIRAADVVVLPYRAIQNSGSAILALSADRPVVVPALGAMRELQEQVGAEWVRCYEGEFDGDELARTLEWAAIPRSDRAPLDRLDWGAIARRTVDAYRWVRDPERVPEPAPETSVPVDR
ncbi:Glycosyltransferase involved in cell wall bisynthesis [Agromyces sp. CF514]|uniref:glycosyltransferase family 4 protein n=1 Tax=Agromyces sp. CF514 TaxID=1881031 RepID=UPI0008E06A06|nr:glycosyltransferase family 4 protein [Agromyces sp. CF514]SFR72280.1 Glycosyltransferase involved in cell wall bisynthesis [Agromyces sp. CF514]